MKPTLYVLLCLTLVNCKRPLTNDEIIEERNKCHEAGMDVQAFRTVGDPMIHAIQCIPPDVTSE